MTDITLEQRARELLAAEMDAIGSSVAARMLLDGWPAAGATVPALRAIEAALRLSAGADWQPIETPPKDAPAHSIGVLVYCPSHGVLNGWYTGFYADNGKFPWSAINTTERPTHWQPLPAAPRHETGEG